MTQGSLLFDGPLARPQLRITAMRPIEEERVEVGIHVSGDAQTPVVRVFSRPVMDEQRALHYLLTGKAPPPEGGADFAVATALMQLGMAPTGKNTGNLLSRFGIRGFTVGTERATRGTLSGTEVHMSGYLSPDVYVRYSISTFDKVNTLRVRYRVRKSLYLEALSGIASAVDLLYSFEH